MYGTDTTVDEELVDRVLTDGVGKLCIHRNGQPIKARRYNIIAGFGRDHNLGVYNNGVDAIARALTERYFFCKDKDSGGFRPAHAVAVGAFTNKHFKEFRSRVQEHLPRLPRLSRQQVVDRYTGSKKRIYTDAMHSLGRKPLSVFDSYLHMFVKYEKQNLATAPRGINPRSPRYNLELGRYLKHAEKPIFEAIHKAFESVADHTVIKGLNAEESATQLRKKFDRFKRPAVVGLDAEKFDMHYSVEALRAEHKTYYDLFPGDKHLRELCSWQLRNTGVAYAEDGIVKFQMSGTRASGDLTTSMGNCRGMCSCVFAYARQRGITVELANNGDDCVVFMESEDVERFCSALGPWFKQRGFSMTVEKPVYVFEEIEFCQTRPVCVDGTWRMIRNHNAVLEKDPMCLIAVQSAKPYRKWLDAVGTCGMILNSGVPVQQAFHAAFKRHGIPCKQAMIDHINRNNSTATRIRGLVGTRKPVQPSTRVSYYYAFGVLPDHQVAIEDAYDHAQIGDWEGGPINRDMLDLEPGIKLLQNEIPW